MNHSLLALGLALFLVFLYNTFQASAILVKVTLILLSGRSSVGATDIPTQTPGNGRRLIRYLLTGLLCFGAAAFVLTMALPRSG